MKINWITLGAALTSLSIVLGAFGAHGLKGKIGYDLLEAYQTGAHYMQLHCLALIVFGIYQKLFQSSSQKTAYAFLIGIFLFSGSLFLMAITNERKLGMITPMGGVSFIAGWIFWALQHHRISKSSVKSA